MTAKNVNRGRRFRRPMLAAEIDGIPIGRETWIEIKRNGWRCMAYIGEGEVELYTRAGNRITQLPYLAEALRAQFPPGTLLDGEIVDLSGGSEIERTRSILGTTRNNYTHRPGDGEPPLTLVVFDVLEVSGRDVRAETLAARKYELQALFGRLPASDLVKLIEYQVATEAALDAILSDGREGAVIKDPRSRYVCGAKGGGAWFKIKREQTLDALLTGFFAPEPGSRFAPLDADQKPVAWAVGGICFTVEHPDDRRYEGRAAGMDDKTRAEMHDHPERFKGAVVEIAHRGIEPSGAPLHPVFKGIRSPADKPASELNTAKARSGKPARAPKKATGAATGVALGGSGRMRNYAGMKPENLLAARESLSARSGDAYERCMEGGSGDPAKDLARVEELVAEKRLG